MTRCLKAILLAFAISSMPPRPLNAKQLQLCRTKPPWLSITLPERGLFWAGESLRGPCDHVASQKWLRRRSGDFDLLNLCRWPERQRAFLVRNRGPGKTRRIATRSRVLPDH
jgi:hypothetical protein